MGHLRANYFRVACSFSLFKPGIENKSWFLAVRISRQWFDYFREPRERKFPVCSNTHKAKSQERWVSSWRWKDRKLQSVVLSLLWRFESHSHFHLELFTRFLSHESSVNFARDSVLTFPQPTVFVFEKLYSSVEALFNQRRRVNGLKDSAKSTLIRRIRAPQWEGKVCALRMKSRRQDIKNSRRLKSFRFEWACDASLVTF